MKKVFLLFLPILIILNIKTANAYKKIKIVGVDKQIWKEIKIPKNWHYTDCQESFVEYPDFIAPTIHYRLHFTDDKKHKLELRFSRHQGILDKNAYLINLTNYEETYIRIID